MKRSTRRMTAEVVREAWRAGREAWPSVDVSEQELAGYLAALAPSADDPLAPLDVDIVAPPHARDVYLACACARGDAAALATFDATYRRELESSIARAGSSSISPDEVRQLVRHKLFVAESGERPRIARYTGQSELRWWVRLVATRIALTVSGRARRELPMLPGALTSLAGACEDPELGYLKRVYSEEFRTAFGNAFGRLEARERTLLRYAFAERLTVDTIGTFYNVHRATVARWIVKAQATLAAHVREDLQTRLAINEEELASVGRLLHGHLDITLESDDEESGQHARTAHG